MAKTRRRSSARGRPLAFCLTVVLASGCLGAIPALYPPPLDDRPLAIYVVDHGWHTGLVVRREDIGPSQWSVPDDFPRARYLEVGWGDRDFYRAERGTLGLAIKAAFVPTASVLHVVGFTAPVRPYFGPAEIVEIRLSRRGFEALSRFVDASHARAADGRIVRLGPGLYGDSAFYLATGTYHLLNTCNTWVAQALRAAGCPITPAYAMTAGNVMLQVRRFGRVL